MKSSFNLRMNEAMIKKGFSLVDISNFTKINYEMIRRYSQGIAIPRSGNLKLIANLLNVTESWLLFGDDTCANNKHNDNSYFIEVMDITASAGKGYINSDVQEVIKLIEYDNEQAKILFNGLSSSSLKVININGDSMQGTFESGDSIYVDVSKRSFEGDGIYVFTFGRNLYVKRLQIIKDKLIVISDNKTYRDWDISENEMDQLYIHGKVMLSQSMLLRKHG